MSLCQACKVWYELLLPNIAASVSSDATIATFDNDIASCVKLVLYGPEKRRRADEVITQTVATQVVAKNLAVSSAAFARCNPSLFARSDGAFFFM